MIEIGAKQFRTALSMATAVRVLQDALRSGLDPEADPPRLSVPFEHGELLLMPAQTGGYAGVKVVTVAPENPARGLPRIQGSYQLYDAATLTPLAVIDGIALTAVRTAAVSAAAADLLAVPDASHLVVFGTGPQAHSHVEALRCIRPLERVTVVARDRARLAAFLKHYEGAHLRMGVGSPESVADADLVACCTTARAPLFDGVGLSERATVVAVGSHEPEARETDDATVRRSTVVVESRSAALREAGDVVQPVRSGVLDPGRLVTLSQLVRGEAVPDPAAPRLFKSVGMAWEDLLLAGAAYEATR